MAYAASQTSWSIMTLGIPCSISLYTFEQLIGKDFWNFWNRSNKYDMMINFDDDAMNRNKISLANIKR